MFLGEQDGPGQAGHRDPLTGAPRAQGLVRDLDVVLGFGQQPFAEMAIDLMTTLMQFIGWQPLQVTGAFGGKKFLREPFRQFFRMVLDELDKTKCNRGKPPAVPTCILRPLARVGSSASSRRTDAGIVSGQAGASATASAFLELVILRTCDSSNL